MSNLPNAHQQVNPSTIKNYSYKMQNPSPSHSSPPSPSPPSSTSPPSPASPASPPSPTSPSSPSYPSSPPSPHTHPCVCARVCGRLSFLCLACENATLPKKRVRHRYKRVEIPNKMKPTSILLFHENEASVKHSNFLNAKEVHADGLDENACMK